MYKTNTIEYDLLQVYKREKEITSTIIKDIQFPIQQAYGSIYIDIEQVLTEQDTGLPYNYISYSPLKLFGNINNKIGVGLYWKDKTIKDHYISITNQFENLRTNIDFLKNRILEKYGENMYNSVSHAIIYNDA